jgi:hypothetical protein
MAVKTNLRQMRRTYRRPEAGDLFTMQLRDHRYLYGRVILANRPLEVAPMPEANLIYVYRDPVDTPDPRANPSRERLLIPPLFINRLPWTKGLFTTLDERPLADADRLPRHCFRHWTGKFVDENGGALASRTEPCGEWGLASYALLDEEVSDALGIPRAVVSRPTRPRDLQGR